jgi:hypothetical protein
MIEAYGFHVSEQGSVSLKWALERLDTA